jgi:hypothetical protein
MSVKVTYINEASVTADRWIGELSKETRQQQGKS